MRAVAVLVVVLLGLVAWPVAAAGLGPGDLVETFGEDGVVETAPYPSDPALLVLGDGDFVTTGIDPRTFEPTFVLTRQTSTGARAPGFRENDVWFGNGRSGIQRARGRALVALPGGDVVAVGLAELTGGQSAMLALRVRPNGGLAWQRTHVLPAPRRWSAVDGALRLPGGRLLVTGAAAAEGAPDETAFAALDPATGELDASAWEGGQLVDGERASCGGRGVAREVHAVGLPDGRFVLAVGYDGCGAELRRYGADGRREAARALVAGTDLTAITQLIAARDGTLLASGRRGRAAVGRFTTDLAAVARFGTAGVASLPGQEPVATALTLAGGGRIVVTPGRDRAPAARLRPDGEPDETFGRGASARSLGTPSAIVRSGAGFVVLGDSLSGDRGDTYAGLGRLYGGSAVGRLRLDPVLRRSGRRVTATLHCGGRAGQPGCAGLLRIGTDVGLVRGRRYDLLAGASRRVTVRAPRARRLDVSITNPPQRQIRRTLPVRGGRRGPG